MMEDLAEEEKKEKQQQTWWWSVTVFTLEEMTMMKKSIKQEDYLFFESQPLSFSTLPTQNSAMYSSSHDDTTSSSSSSVLKDSVTVSSVDHSVTVESTVQFKIPRQTKSTTHQRSKSQSRPRSHPNKLIMFIELSKISMKNQKKNQVITNRTIKTLKQNDHDVKNHPLVIQEKYDHEESINLDQYCSDDSNHLVTNRIDYDGYDNTHEKRHKDNKNITSMYYCGEKNDSFDSLVRRWVPQGQIDHNTMLGYTLLKEESLNVEGLCRQSYREDDDSICTTRMIQYNAEQEDTKDALLVQFLNYLVVFLCVISVILSCFIFNAKWEFVLHLFANIVNTTLAYKNWKPKVRIKGDHGHVKKEMSDIGTGLCIGNSFSTIHHNSRSSSENRREAEIIIIIDDSDDEDNVNDNNNETMVPPLVRRKYNPDLFPSHGSISTSCSTNNTSFFDNSNTRHNDIPAHTALDVATTEESMQQNINDTLRDALSKKSDKDNDTSKCENENLIEPLLTSNIISNNIQLESEKNKQGLELSQINSSNGSSLADENREDDKHKKLITLSQDSTIMKKSELMKDPKLVGLKRNIRELHQDTPETFDSSTERSCPNSSNCNKKSSIYSNKKKSCLDDISRDTATKSERKHYRLSITRTKLFRQAKKQNELGSNLIDSKAPSNTDSDDFGAQNDSNVDTQDDADNRQAKKQNELASNLIDSKAPSNTDSDDFGAQNDSNVDTQDDTDNRQAKKQNELASDLPDSKAPSNTDSDDFGAQNDSNADTQDDADNHLIHNRKGEDGGSESKRGKELKKIETNLKPSDPQDSNANEISYLDERKLSLLPPPMFSSQKKISFIPPPPVNTFMPSSELVSASKAVKSPVWEFASSTTTTKHRVVEETKGVTGTDDKKNKRHQISPLSSANKPTLHTRITRRRTRSRTRSMQNNIPRTIVVASNTYDDDDDGLSLPGDKNDDNRRKRKSRKEEVDKSDESGRSSNNSLSKRSRLN